MNKTLLEKLIQWPRPFITGVDLAFFISKSDDARKGIIKRAVKEGYLLKLRRDLFLIKKIPNKPLNDNFEIAQYIYGPSYISFESALSCYGWIPESVPIICSATMKKSKKVKTYLGTFSYEEIPASIYSIGLHHQVDKNGSSYFMAQSAKALADLIYRRRKSWKSLEGLMEDLRIEKESLQEMDRDLLAFLSEHYPNTRTRVMLHLLMENLWEK